MASRGSTVAVATSVLLVLSTLAACQTEQRVPTPTASPITEAQAEQLYQDNADSLRQGFEIRHPGVEVPDVAGIRFVEPQEFTQALLDCLGAAGFTASALPDGHPVSDPPTRQSFVETYGSTDTWTPYSDVAPGTNEEWYALNKKCPQMPEGLYG